MKYFRIGLLLLAGLLAFAPAARSADNAPLFVNLTTDHAHRATMAIAFSKNQLERKHPVTIFLNDRAVLIGSKAGARKFKSQQDMLGQMLKDGATVLVCPMCMKHYGVKEADLLPGLKLGNPELTGAALFKDNGKTLSW